MERVRWTHPATLTDEELLEQCELSKDRSGGPGGQHRNKVETRVTLVHLPTGITAMAGERRSVIDNRRVALRRLRLLLAIDFRCPVPVGEIGTDLWRGRLKKPAAGSTGGRIACNPNHHDYPALLAEALDTIATAGWELQPAALRLDVSPSQLLKLIKEHPAAFVRLNREREAQHKHPLK